MLWLGACATLPQHIDSTPSTAFAHPEETTIGRYFAPHCREHAGLSGYTVVRNSRDAFIFRVGLADYAERSLDLQYYIWESDTTGKILASKVLAAANRGVRVRILLDDNNFEGRDFTLAAIDSHPLIEVRMFNPFANRGMHAFDFMTHYSRVNRRMHNKVMIADGAVAVVGGRNIGDHYFGVHDEANFRDLDLGVIGPAVGAVAASFDAYWNSSYAIPISALHHQDYTQKDFDRLERELQETLSAHPYPYEVNIEVEQLTSQLDRLVDSMIWAQGRVLVDDPTTLAEGGTQLVKQSLIDWVSQARQEVLIESAYFVLRKESIGMIGDAVQRGVHVRVLTNSLASNDVAAAHSGYAKIRDDLLDHGVELYELRPDAHAGRREWSLLGGHSIAALHTKAMVIDDRSVYVGSFNLDPRSADINTEFGLIVDSEALAASVAEFMDAGVAPGNAFHVTRNDRGQLRWDALEQGEQEVLTHEPEAGFWKRFMAQVLKLLPIQSQL